MPCKRSTPVKPFVTICNWIKAFYENIKSSVIVNGKASQSFQIRRGCRQGDPISPYLFILCAELMACKIRENKSIKGIQLTDIHCIISQFADDTVIFLEGDKKSYEKTFEILKEFENLSGLKLNCEKTCNMWIGSKCNSETRYLPHLKMSWNPPKLKILGLWFTNDLTNVAEINLTEKFQETKKLFNIWMKRTTTPLGRVAILKSVILSKLTYLWIMLPNPPDNVIQQLQTMCFQFVWDKKRDKVKRKVATQDIQNGGMSIPHIAALIKSLKLTWLKKCYSKTQCAKWKQILLKECPQVEMLEEYGSFVLKIGGRPVNMFWKDVFKGYIEFFEKN